VTQILGAQNARVLGVFEVADQYLPPVFSFLDDLHHGTVEGASPSIPN
jgi:hypothetical protein